MLLIVDSKPIYDVKLWVNLSRIRVVCRYCGCSGCGSYRNNGDWFKYRCIHWRLIGSYN